MLRVLDLPSLPQFAGIEALLQGGPAARREFDWHGELRAAEPVVGLAVVASPGGVEWCKSDRARKGGLAVRLYLGWNDAQGLDVRVHWEIGGGQRVARTALRDPATSTFDLVPNLTAVESGSLRRVFTLRGTPEVNCWALLVPSRFVEVGRSGLWSLRPKWREGLPGPWLDILSQGRTGRIEFTGSAS